MATPKPKPKRTASRLSKAEIEAIDAEFERDEARLARRREIAGYVPPPKWSPSAIYTPLLDEWGFSVPKTRREQ